MKLTIFTPTYNRQTLLERCYESLKKQTNLNFIWMIIDDGSTDETQKKVEQWIKENKINIEYYYKENGGKHTAYNYFIEKLKTEYALIALDSDDWLKENAVSIILNDLNNLQQGYVGITYPCCDINGDEDRDIEQLEGKSLSYVLNNNLLDCECEFIIKSEYLKDYRFPIINGEKFFTEAYLYLHMDAPMMYKNDIFYLFEYQEDGLTRNTIKSFANNPNSWRLYNEIRMKKNTDAIKRIKYTIYYICFCILSHFKIFKKEYKVFRNLKMFFLIPIGWMMSLYIRKKVK